MKVRIDAIFLDGDAGKWREPGQIVNVKDSRGAEWIANGWGIELKDIPEKAEIETPENETEATRRETATMRRKQ